jgi:C4-dicarboxylate transporter DctM subunit
VLIWSVLMPIAVGFGIDPIHFGVLIAVNLSIGLVTPPYGICLFVACSVTGRKVMQVAPHLGLPLAAMILVQAIITYVPDLVLYLPRTFLS